MQTHTTLTNSQPADTGPLPATGGLSVLDELLTADQVAGLLQMRLSTVEDYARRGVLPSVKLGRHRRFIRSDVEHAILAIADQPKAARRYRASSASRLSPESLPRGTR